jgi:hypothetical protein
MSSEPPPSIADARRTFGAVLYWLTIASCVVCIIGPVVAMSGPGRNVLGKHYLFSSIFAGDDPAAVWQRVEGGFPGAHFYLWHPLTGDGLTQFGLALIGCSAAAWALLAAALIYARQGVRLYAVLSLALALLILAAVTGVI